MRESKRKTKLTLKDLNDIRTYYDEDVMTRVELMKKYKISHKRITDILSGKEILPSGHRDYNTNEQPKTKSVTHAEMKDYVNMKLDYAIDKIVDILKDEGILTE